MGITLQYNTASSYLQMEQLVMSTLGVTTLIYTAHHTLG